MSLLTTSGRRFLLRHPWQTGLAVAGIALGVAVVVGVDLANDSVGRAFDASTEIVAGRSTHQLLPTDDALADSLYVRLRTELGIRNAAPVVEGTVRLGDDPDRGVTLLGLDPFAERPFRGYLGIAAAGDMDISRLLREPDSVVLARALADRLDVQPGNTLAARVGAGERTLVVAGTVDLSATAGAGELILTDISTAQELAGRAGLTRIDLILDEDEAAALRGELPPSVELVTTGARNRGVLGMTRAFRVNLTALSLLALLVGAFLIYSTLSFMVVRRRQVHGMLRAVGVTGRQLFASTLAEALMVGIPGTLAGLALGQLLGAGLVTLVTRTVDDLYFSVVAAPSSLGWLSLAKGVALGIGGTLAAAVVPAREASLAFPRRLLSRASMERRTAASVPVLAAWSLAVMLMAVGVLAISDSLVVSFVGLFLFVLGAALMTPAATVGVTTLLQRLGGSALNLPARLAIRGVASSLSRTGIAVAALTVAVAAVIGIGTMIASFRLSVSDWLSQTVSADMYVAYPRGSAVTLDDAFVEQVEAIRGVASTRVIRQRRLPQPDGDLRLWALRMEPPGRGMELVSGDPETAWTNFAASDALLVSEPYAAGRGLIPGDSVTLRTSNGPRVFAVAGVFRDYTTDQGVVAMHLDVYRRHWPDRALSGVGVFLNDDANPAAVRTHIERLGDGVVVTESQEIRRLSLAVFDRTFTVTEVLRLLAGIVAFLGVFSALQSLELERAREIAVLRALGLSPAQVSMLTLAQTGLLGLAAGLFAVPVGIGLAWLLIRVINERAFGWTMGFDIAGGALWQGIVLAVAAALMAGIHPALQSARTLPAAHLREE